MVCAAGHRLWVADLHGCGGAGATGCVGYPSKAAGAGHWHTLGHHLLVSVVTLSVHVWASRDAGCEPAVSGASVISVGKVQSGVGKCMIGTGCAACLTFIVAEHAQA
eukprot:1159593-Pelagomonas_calceolata.AAC.4